jgi:hypothetical protein
LGTKVTVDYLKRGEDVIFIDVYNENSKMDLIVKNMRRSDDAGILILDTEDEDGAKYEVYVYGLSILNFNHSDLKENDIITVYPNEIRETHPTQIDAKMIKKH